MSDRPTATDDRPPSHTVRDRFMGNAVTANVATWLGARLAIADPAEQAAHPRGGFGG